jgi:hypothetical protein
VKNQNLNSLNQISVSNLKNARAVLKEIEVICENAKLDLNFRLNDLRDKIAPDQQEKFKSEVMGLSEIQQQSSESINENTQSSDKTEASKVSHPQWAKSLYKKIVVKAHPDKNINHPHQEEKKRYEKIYQDSVSCYKCKEYAYLIVNGYEVNIGLGFMTHEHRDITDKKFKEVNENINSLKLSQYWGWASLQEKDRMTFLKNYFGNMGYTISEKEVIETLRKKPNRKPGTRPKNNLKTRKLTM